MSIIRGRLNRFLRFSNVDGPGNRFVLFLQGCNFDCINCHNPHTIGVCDGCGACVAPCPEEALRLAPGPTVVVRRDRCTECGVCIDVCPHDATPLDRWVTVPEMFEEIRRTAPFLSGITVSGGEATLQAEFVAALFRAVRRHPETAHLTTLVDSNGSAPPEVWNRLLPVMDGAMIDLKALDDATHVRLTGRHNDAVLASIRHLAGHDRLHEVRLLVVPGYSDDPEAMAATGRWLRRVAPRVPVRLIAFRRHGVRPAFAFLEEPDGDRMAELAAALRRADIRDLVVV